MKKTFTLLSMLAVVLAMTATSADADTVLTLKLEADRVGASLEYEVRVYASVTGTGTDEGLADVEFDIHSSTSVGITNSVEKSPPPASGKVKTTWDTAIAAAFTTLSPLYDDIGTDGDMDARMAAFSDMKDYAKLDVGLGGWTLLCTETWVMDADEETWLEVTVNPGSRHFDWAVADPYKTPFDAVVGEGTMVGVPEPMTMSLLAIGGLALIRRKK